MCALHLAFTIHCKTSVCWCTALYSGADLNSHATSFGLYFVKFWLLVLWFHHHKESSCVTLNSSPPSFTLPPATTGLFSVTLILSLREFSINETILNATLDACTVLRSWVSGVVAGNGTRKVLWGLDSKVFVTSVLRDGVFLVV